MKTRKKNTKVKAKKKKQPNLKSKITSALRQVWKFSETRKEALKKARISRGIYQCELCGHTTGPKGVQVDHIVPCRMPGDDSWDGFIERLFCPVDGLQVICCSCHAEETEKQRKKRAEAKKC